MPNRGDVIIAIPMLLTGGTEIQTYDMAKVLIDEGFTVTLLCYYEYETEVVATFHDMGIKVSLLKLKREDGLFTLLKHLKSILQELKPDIVHVQYVAPGLIPILAARFAGVTNVVATVHQSGRNHGLANKHLLKIAAKFCSAFICVSKTVEKSWFGSSTFFDIDLFKSGRKHFTIYNSVNIEQIVQESNSDSIAKKRSDLGLENQTIIGYIGRLRWEKGPHILLAAFAKVIVEVPGVMLLIVGDGPDREALLKQANELSLEANIIWLGRLPHSEAIQYYALMDVVAVPSLWEGFGLTAAEAMVAGVPVVGSDIDGLSEIIQNPMSGVLVQPGNPLALSSALIDLIKNRKMFSKWQENNRIETINTFSPEAYRKSLLNVYQLLLSG